MRLTLAPAVRQLVLQRDRRFAALALEPGDHRVQLLVGEADRRLVDRRHARIEAGYDECVRLAECLREVLELTQPGNAGLGALGDSGEVGEASRFFAADRVTGRAKALAVSDLVTDL